MHCEKNMKGNKKTLRWFCGVPLLANPLIWTDLLSILAVVWFIALLLMCAAQLLFGSGALLPSHVTASAIYASYLAFILLAVFLLTAIAFYPKGYVMLYRLEDIACYMESMRGHVPNGSPFRFRPFAVGEFFSPKRSVTKEVLWSRVSSFYELQSMKTIILKGRMLSIARIYCPDETTYEAVLDFVRERVKGRLEN